MRRNAILWGPVETQVARIIAQAQAQDLRLTRARGLLPDMIKQAVEAALQAEMTDQVGYGKHEAEGRRSGFPATGSRVGGAEQDSDGACAGASGP